MNALLPIIALRKKGVKSLFSMTLYGLGIGVKPICNHREGEIAVPRIPGKHRIHWRKVIQRNDFDLGGVHDVHTLSLIHI